MDPGPDVSRHIDRQALTREIIDDRQALQRPAIRARVEDEVIGPHVIPRGRGLRPEATRGHPPPQAPPRHVQARLAPQPIGPFGTHRVPPAREKDPDLPIAVPRILPRELAHDRQGRRIALLEP